MIEVLAGGLLSTCQDRGRPGHAHQGIGACGAADMDALAVANALVGNDADACAIEITLHGPTLLFRRDAWLALVGAPMPQAVCNDQPLRMWGPCHVAEGAKLSLGGMPRGCRAWLAVDGGVDVPCWLGSRSCDVANSLGPAPLAAGQSLPFGTPGDAPVDDGWWLDSAPWWQEPGTTMLRILPARDSDSLDAASNKALVEAEFTATVDSNRTGVRLKGPQLRWQRQPDVASSGVLTGTMQLPPGGEPILLGCEHPVTGGYPRIGQLIEADWPRLAQLRPGDKVRFVWVTHDEARKAHILAQTVLRETLARIAMRRSGSLPT